MTTNDVVFSRGRARRPAPSLGSADPVLIWASGLQTNRRTIHVGWISEVGKFDDFDEACDLAGFNKVTIRHAEGRAITHWDIDDPRFFIMCDGIQQWGESQHTDTRYGIAMGWHDRVNQNTGKRESYSILKMKVLLRAFCEIGLFIPLVISVKRLFTQDVMKCLIAHLDMLDVAEELSRKNGKSRDFPFYAFDLALLPGNSVQRGSKGMSREVSPITTDIPDKEQITRDFLLARHIRPEWIQQIEYHMDDVVAWSEAVSKAIKTGNDEQVL